MNITEWNNSMTIQRSVDQGSEQDRQTVQSIIQDVRQNGDAALFAYTKKWDRAELTTLRVSKKEIEQALQTIDPQLKQDLQEAADNIRAFHELQLRDELRLPLEHDSYLSYRFLPMDAAGLYVPGGTAAYPSSVLMNAIPAKVAGVGKLVITTPPNPDGSIPVGVLVAASIARVDEIYKVGGAQAIAALAYGTESIPKVDKITGPGNRFVALAKREVFGTVSIDSIAGPSEIAVLADDTARAADVAADLIAQAEHDVLACSILITTSQSLADQVKTEVERQLSTLPRQDIARASIEDYGMIYVTESMEQAIEAVNQLAPEHLEILTEDAEKLSRQIRHAGAIFLGRYSSEPIGDYFAGTNHVLPTNSTARFSSGLSVEDFQKKTSVIYYTKELWNQNYPKIARLARMEQLEGHARAVEIRKDQEEINHD
ncbi:histidinol dehydrogenase [Chryseomicrobium excrementi]|uniref:Histidinol dehydrogenase n=1 Tax=Chryseomicrobium excrementi TaxID=2041346 RepID=A0A2M9F130_9BACL|nr:histidinol dehydrogenase [Chryseomicrobium excrementi]PJK17167.1 histidinol dehydrogenase [Chryseomicrobium excrementi]